tara:strand:- start:3 stop:443 length:441 start_codon:yes stop_codon:yes gene_type:complete
MALAEMVLERLAEGEKEFTPAELTSQTAEEKKASQATKRGDRRPRAPKTRDAGRIEAMGHSNAGKTYSDGTPAPNPMAREAPKELADPEQRTGPRGDIDNSAAAAAINRTQLISKLARGRGHKTPKVIGDHARAEAVRGSKSKIAS